ncbi:hypothetical protein DPMN_113764 [Dreissena polymorpha]|uniref:Uncharacterized protein n=1 Tax=Dreissena polymorpha TaxID=45954 RepID=A0A9D4QRU4_DREPO|nr:hypothetical protein DPMN_113764 [Dreissena polymorpha]
MFDNRATSSRNGPDNGAQGYPKVLFENRCTEIRQLEAATIQSKASVIADADGHLLTESAAVLTRWTECCRYLYNLPASKKTTVSLKTIPDQRSEGMKIFGNGQRPFRAD